jgi:RNA polymerase sigma-70 factor (ECF subfamily)
MARDDTPEDELELLKRWQAGGHGSDRAGEILFGRYFQPIARFFQSKCPDAVEDLVQETFLAVQKGRERITQTSFRNYLFGTACNMLRTHLRRKTHEHFDSRQMSIASLSPGISSLMAATDQQRVLQLALQRVPLDDQIVLELRFWEGMTAPQIAEVLDGIPLGTVSSRLRRAIKRLEATIAEIEASPELLEMTLRDFSAWKDDIQAMLGLADDDDAADDNE